MTLDDLLIEIDENEATVSNADAELIVLQRTLKVLESKIDGTRTLKSQFASIVHHAKTEAKVVDFEIYCKSKKSLDSCEQMLHTLFQEYETISKKKTQALETKEIASKTLVTLKNQSKDFGKVIKREFRRSTGTDKKG